MTDKENKIPIKGYATFDPLKVCWIGSGFKTEWFHDLPIGKNHKMARLLYKNYQCVYLMCQRHPAHNLALIDELENKLMQDQLFIDEVRQKLREQGFEDVLSLAGGIDRWSEEIDRDVPRY